MNNNYNNQTPPQNNRPDYSYNWNGSDNNNKNGGNGLKVLAIIAIVIGALALTVLGVMLARNFDFELPEVFLPTESQTSGTEGDESGNEESSLDFSRDPDISVPDFSVAPDSDIDLSTDLSKIYNECSPSCCTVRVSLNGQPYSIGSGFVIDADGGYIATNHHVIETGNQITVAFYDGREYDAKIVGSDSVTDIAVLHVEAKGLTQVSFGDSGKIKIGENVVAIGTPYDETLAGTMTCGIVSGTAREVQITNDYGKVVKTMKLIQTDCSINPGNSGGPLIDMAGNVIGITSLKIADEQFEGIGFAIPITSAIDIFQKLIAGEDIGDSDIAVATPQIGITVYDVEDGLEYFRMNPRCEYPEGVLIADIEFNSSAYTAGLSRYDIITDFNGTEVKNREDLTTALSKHRAGETVTVTVFRFNRMLTSGEYETITFKLDAAE